MDRLSSPASAGTESRRLLRAQHVESSVELAFLEQADGIFASYLVVIDLAMIALSCHYALDLLRYKEGVYDSA